MLQKLEIQNYILIDALSIDLSAQLSVITGETGAGKSIIMGALGLILGDRADSTVCRNPEKKCFIEGVFKLSNTDQYKTFFDENEIDLSNELIRSRCAFVTSTALTDPLVNSPLSSTALSFVKSDIYSSSRMRGTLKRSSSVAGAERRISSLLNDTFVTSSRNTFINPVA